MPHLPENARLWLERAEIDYIGPFVKAWACLQCLVSGTASGQPKGFRKVFAIVKAAGEPCTKRDHAAFYSPGTDWMATETLLPDDEAGSEVQAS